MTNPPLLDGTKKYETADPNPVTYFSEITLRDLFAGQMMHAQLLGNMLRDYHPKKTDMPDFAKGSYEAADALLAEREK